LTSAEEKSAVNLSSSFTFLVFIIKLELKKMGRLRLNHFSSNYLCTCVSLMKFRTRDIGVQFNNVYNNPSSPIGRKEILISAIPHPHRGLFTHTHACTKCRAFMRTHITHTRVPLWESFKIASRTSLARSFESFKLGRPRSSWVSIPRSRREITTISFRGLNCCQLPSIDGPLQ